MQDTEKFKLDRDGATAKIRFLYGSIDEVVVERCDKASDMFQYGHGIIHVPIFNVDKDCYQIWERGVFAYRMLDAIYRKYEDVPSKVFEVTHYGNKGDPTAYYVCNCIT